MVHEATEERLDARTDENVTQRITDSYTRDLLMRMSPELSMDSWILLGIAERDLEEALRNLLFFGLSLALVRALLLEPTATGSSPTTVESMVAPPPPDEDAKLLLADKSIVSRSCITPQ